ncbi:hypothetical protein F5Y19DRAFT_484670 [Xylariaceae sp. FL1651]|nr:hypothetical protein F5Y19DRAFT_484670 [Xylariaceae sp. FL1651]
MPRRARFACNACRRLKRKCPRELPSCSLCIRLEKDCEYPPRAVQTSSAGAGPGARSPPQNRAAGAHVESPPAGQGILDTLNSAMQQPSSFGHVASDALTMYFLDSEGWNKPLSPNQPSTITTDPNCPLYAEAQDVCLSMSWHMPLPEKPAHRVAVEEEQEQEHPPISPAPEVQKILDCYFSTIHPWLPLLSKKHLRRILAQSTSSISGVYALLLSCMKLLAEPLSPTLPTTASLGYRAAKEALLRVESASPPSLALLQSVILLAVYELGHGVYPAAYLRVGHASRLALMFGLHDRRHAAQLFRDTATWTAREEERRAWWAVFVLDRLAHQGLEGVPLSTPEPCPGELLPSPEHAWDAGAVGFNEPLFAAAFSDNTSLGGFANLCQAAHILGRVLRHRYEKKSGGDMEFAFRIAEATQLHSLLVSLQAHLANVSCAGAGAAAAEQQRQQPWSANTRGEAILSHISLALCFSARLILYGQYACNERLCTDHGRLSEEAKIQRLSLDGIVEVARATHQLVRRILDDIATLKDNEDRQGYPATSPLICACLFAAAQEAEWWILEHEDMEAVTWLKDIAELLAVMEKRWHIAGVYMAQIRKWPTYNSIMGGWRDRL